MSSITNTPIVTNNAEEVHTRKDVEPKAETEQESIFTKTLVVQNGEDVNKIANKIGCTTQELIDANRGKIHKKGSIFYFLVGENIIIPKDISDEEFKTLNAGRKSRDEAIQDYINLIESQNQKRKEENTYKQLGLINKKAKEKNTPANPVIQS